MAIAFGSATNAGYPATGASLVINAPANTASGNLLICTFLTSVSTTITPPAGWNVGIDNLKIKSFWLVAGGSEPSDYTFTRSTTTHTAVGMMVRVTGAHPSAPIETSSSLQSTGAGTSIVIPSVTVTDGFFLLQMVSALSTPAATFTAPGTATEDFDAAPIANRASAAGHETVGAGATGTRTWTISTSANQFGGATFALLDAPPVSSAAFLALL